MTDIAGMPEHWAQALRSPDDDPTLRALSKLDTHPVSRAIALAKLAWNRVADAFEPTPAKIPDDNAPGFDDLLQGLSGADAMERAAIAGRVANEYADRGIRFLKPFDAPPEVPADVDRLVRFYEDRAAKWTGKRFVAMVERVAIHRPDVWRAGLFGYCERCVYFPPAGLRDHTRELAALVGRYPSGDPADALEEAVQSFRFQRARLQNLLVRWTESGTQPAVTLPGEK